MDDQKTPASWYIWIVFWILPILLSLGTYKDDLDAAIGTWVGSGILVILMVIRAKWVLPWFCVVLIFDLIGFGFLLGEGGADIGFLVGTFLKEMIFLGYLLFSDNAKRHQSRLTQTSVSKASEV